jgi:hypothetical protein
MQLVHKAGQPLIDGVQVAARCIKVSSHAGANRVEARAELGARAAELGARAADLPIELA